MFRVEQSTGKATLNAEAFDLSGLRQLSLGSVALGNFGATVNEFSTDGTLGDNSDIALVTEKAIRTFVENQLGGGQNNLTVNSAVIGEITIVIKGFERIDREELNKSKLKKELEELINAGLSLSAASKYLAKKKNLTKNLIYNLH